MANKKVVGELVYEIRGDDSQYNKVINNADTKARGLGKTVSGVSGDMVKNLAGAYLGWQGLKAGIDATVGSAIRYEDAFAGVRKTVNASEEELQALSKQFRQLAKEIPVSANEFARIGELAGQLGVPTKQIGEFSKTISQIATSTNLTTEQASLDFARFANIMGMPIEQTSNLGSAIVDLGNNFATTESEIIDFAMRIAGAGKIAGLTEAQVLAIGAAMSSVGIEAEAGGTAVQKVLQEMTKSVAQGGVELEKIAIVAGMTSEEFSTAFKDDAGNAFNEFVKGLGLAGDDAFSILKELGLEDVRLSRAFISLAGAGDLLTDAIDLSTEAFIKNTALAEEAEKRYKTTKSQIQLLKNNFNDLGISVGSFVLPIINTFIKALVKVTEAINVLSDELILTIKWLGTTVGLAWAFKAVGISSMTLSGLFSTLTARTLTLRGALIALRTALLAIPLALVITVGLAGYTLIMNQIKNLKRELNEQVESETALADQRMKTAKDNGALIRSENKNLQELGKAQNEFQRVFINSQDNPSVLDKRYLDDAREKIKLAKEKVNQDEEALKILNKNTSATDENADATGELGEEYKSILANLNKLSSGTKDNNDAMKEAEDEAKKLIDRWIQLEDQTIDLEDKGTKAIQELAENNIKDLEKIEEKITSLKIKLLELQEELSKDLASEDAGIAEKIVAEQNKILEIKQKIADLEKEQVEKYTDERASDITELKAELLERERVLKENADLQTQLDTEIAEAKRRADLSELERSIEDYLAKKAQIQLEYEEKKLALENELLLEEENKAKTLALLQDKQEQINAIIELGNQRFKDLSDNRVKITEDEVKKQIAWYNKLSEAIAKSKSATRTSELPQFHKGGYVANGGEVHAGEYVIPANMVNKYSGLIKALEGARIGSAGSTTNNNINMNNVINEQIDMDAVLKNMSFELNK